MPLAAGDTIVFVSLAMNQTTFFKAIGDRLEQEGYHTAYVSFHERSHEWLAASGARSYNPFAMQPADPDRIDLGDYGVTGLNLLLGHEKAAYELRDSAALETKLKRHCAAVDRIFGELGDLSRVHLVQELGGFLSVLAAFYVARKHGVDNWFIEPSFFRGRVFFTPNSFRAPAIDGPHGEHVSAEVAAVLDQAVAQQSIVIPAKDRHHYRGVLHKILDTRHIRRFVEKSVDKHLLGKREEFGHVGGHVRRHLRMLATSLRLRRRYSELLPGERFIYYPLHVPADFALTVRSPEYLDQYALIDFLCRAVPAGYRVAIKEHPAMIGAVAFSRMQELLARHDNLVLLNPGLRNYAVMHAASAVVTVNSKSGAEALLLGKPVYVLGDAFYGASDLVQRVDRLGNLPARLAQVASGEVAAIDARSVRAYFQRVFDRSFPGELYQTSTENVDKFSSSLQAALRSADFVTR